MAKKNVLVIAIHSQENNLINTISHSFSELAQRCKIDISIDCPKGFNPEIIDDVELFESILDSATNFITQKTDFKLAVVADQSLEKLQKKK